MKIFLLTCIMTGLALVTFAQQPSTSAIEMVRDNFNKTIAKKVISNKQDAVWLYGYYESDHTITMIGNDSLFVSYAETNEAPKRNDVTISHDYGNVHTKLHNYTFSLKDVVKVSVANVTGKESEVGFLKIETRPGAIHARHLFLEATYEIKDPSWEGGSSVAISAAIMDDKQEVLSTILLPYLKNDVYNSSQLVTALMTAAGID